MPQMSPIFWSYMFILFIMLTMFIMIKIYFFINPKNFKNKENNLNSKYIKIKWMW